MLKLILAYVLILLSAEGAVIASFDRNEWARRTRVAQTIDFSGLASTGDFLNVSGGLTMGGIEFVPVNGSLLYVADRDTPGYDFGLPAVLTPQLGFPSGFRATLPAGVTAVGTDLAGFLGEAVDFDILVTTSSGNVRFALAGGSFPPLGFFGLTSTEAIRAVTFVSNGNDSVFGNFTTGAAVPEPSTFALSAGALLFLAVMSRRVRRA